MLTAASDRMTKQVGVKLSAQRDDTLAQKQMGTGRVGKVCELVDGWREKMDEWMDRRIDGQ